MVKEIIIGALAVLAVVLLVLLFRVSPVVIQLPSGERLGATSGQNFYFPMTFEDTVTFSGNISNSATTTLTGPFIPDAIGEGVLSLVVAGGSSTITAANFCDNNVISVDTGSGQSTSSLPTGQTLAADCLDAEGSQRRVLVRNIGAGTLFFTTTTVISAATQSSTTLQMTSSTDAANHIGSAESAYVNAILLSRQQATATMVLFTQEYTFGGRQP